MVLATILLLLPSIAAQQNQRPPAPALVLILTTPGADKRYHDPACPRVRGGRDVQALTRGRAESLGYRAHTCVDAPPPSEPAPAPRSSKPSNALAVNRTPVWGSSGSNKYHRGGCRALGANPVRLTLENAARTYWPCPICKPPIRERDVKGIEVMNWKKKKP